jgi:hypothetical protein
MNLRVLVAAVALTSASGCTADTVARPSSTAASTTDGYTVAPQVSVEPTTNHTAVRSSTAPGSNNGCGSTVVAAGEQIPPWAEVGASFLRFVTSDEGNAVGFLFADPLRAAPRDDGKNNKVLWVVREPRNGSDLTIAGTLNGEVVTSSEPANSGPGEIYPSIVDVPKPGCWHFTLRWGDNVANLDLLFEA